MHVNVQNVNLAVVAVVVERVRMCVPVFFWCAITVLCRVFPDLLKSHSMTQYFEGQKRSCVSLTIKFSFYKRDSWIKTHFSSA